MSKNRGLKPKILFEKHGLEAMLFTDMRNIRYLTGFSGTDGALIVTEQGSTLLCDSRYTTQAKQQVSCNVVEYKQKIPGIVRFLAEETRATEVGFESLEMSVDVFNELTGHSSSEIKYIPINDSTSIRKIKDSEEIGKIIRAAEISASALNSILNFIRPGVSEKEIALELEISTRRYGSEEKAFDFIVASGERGAMPHGVASDKLVENGDVITIDFGSCFEGYFSDETINLAVGEIQPEMQKIHDIVQKAHDLAINSVKPGAYLSEIDKIARDFISEKGYGTYFGHGLGHGVGLNVHEAPRVSPQSDAVAEEGMVFTIEPGIYIPGLGGVRIEDMIVVTADGFRVLTTLPKDLRLLTN